MKLLRFIAVLLLLAGPAWAGDLQRTTTFTDGQRIYASQLHGLIDNTSINTTFITRQSSVGTLASGDYFLVWSAAASGFRKISGSGLVYGNTALITSQTEETAPATNDMVLLYDTSALGFKKASVANLSLFNTNLIAVQPEITNLLSSAYLLALNDGTNNKVTASNLFWSLQTYNKPFTNLAAATTLTNADALMVFNSAAGTNRQLTIAGLITNAPASSQATNTDTFLVVSNGVGIVAKVTLGKMSDVISNNILPGLTTNFTSYSYQLPDGGSVVSTNHGLGAVPKKLRVVMVCQSTDGGYAAADEVDADGFYDDNNEPAFVYGANATTVFVVLSSRGTNLIGSRLETKHKTTGSGAPCNGYAWRAKVYASP